MKELTYEEWKNRYKELSNNYEEMMYKYNKLGEFFAKTSEEVEKTKKENEQLKQQIEKMKHCGNCNKEKEIIKNLIDTLEVIDGEQIRTLGIVKEAEEFIKE